MTKYTPGPWKIDRRGPSKIRSMQVDVSTQVCVAIPNGFGSNFAKTVWFSAPIPAKEAEEALEHDAALIAAAPELLEAAKAALKLPFPDASLWIHDVLTEAIAKAEGKGE